MKKFVLFTLLTFALYSSVPLAADGTKPCAVSFQSKDDVQAYLKTLSSSIEETIQNILSVPVEKQTYENIFGAWNRLTVILASDLSDLFATDGMASIAQDFQKKIYDQIFQNIELRDRLTSFAQKALKNGETLNPCEKNLLSRFLASFNTDLNQVKKPPPYVQSKDTPYKNYSFSKLRLFSYNTKSLHSDPQKLKQLAKKTLLQKADVVCLQEVFLEEDAYRLFEVLKGLYPYFYLEIGPRPISFSSDTIRLNSGLFIASKYPLQEVQFTPLSQKDRLQNIDLFDYVITDGNLPQCHIYTTHLKADSSKDMLMEQMKMITDKIQEDFLKNQRDQIPFLLCGELDALTSMCDLIEEHFTYLDDKEGTQHVLLFPSIGTSLTSRLLQMYQLKVNPVTLFGNIYGLVTDFSFTIKPMASPTNSGTILPIGPFMLHKGDDENSSGQLSAGGDSNGNFHVDGSYNYDYETSNGMDINVTVSGGVSVDKDGSVDSKVSGDVTLKF